MPLRPELLHFERPEGGLDLYDPLLQRLHSFPEGLPAEPELAQLLLVEGPAITALRQQVWRAARSQTPKPPPAGSLDPAPWDLAPQLPPAIAPAWRQPEAWRRLAEERLAGRSLLILRGFWPEAEALAQALRGAEWQRLDTELVHAHRLTDSPALLPLRDALQGPCLRTLLGAALGVSLPQSMQVNAWRLSPGDHFRAHPDGPRYRATFALGLNEGWTAALGGAIAFGTPGPQGLEVQERWLPFAGDLCCFVPHAQSWHVVEPPGRERLTVSGWWL